MLTILGVGVYDVETLAIRVAPRVVIRQVCFYIPVGQLPVLG